MAMNKECIECGRITQLEEGMAPICVPCWEVATGGKL